MQASVAVAMAVDSVLVGVGGGGHVGRSQQEFHQLGEEGGRERSVLFCVWEM